MELVTNVDALPPEHVLRAIDNAGPQLSVSTTAQAIQEWRRGKQSLAWQLSQGNLPFHPHPSHVLYQGCGVRWGEDWEARVSRESCELLGLLKDIFQGGPSRDRDGVSVWWQDTGDLQHDTDELLGL